LWFSRGERGNLWVWSFEMAKEGYMEDGVDIGGWWKRRSNVVGAGHPYSAWNSEMSMGEW